MKKIESFFIKHKMAAEGETVVVGLSGGADSVCLFLVLIKLAKKYHFNIVAVHVHHGIRGVQADADLEFCRELCEKNNIELKVFRYDVPALAKKMGSSCEETGRKLRYEAFETVAAGCEHAKIAVAHHMNDQAETVLFNLCRGSALKGARGMLPVRGKIIRPLLCCMRSEIEAYLCSCGMNYCTDSTNFENDYTRNRMRNVVLPYLEKEINAGSVRNLAAFADRVAQTENYLDMITCRFFEKTACVTEEGILLQGLDKQDVFMAKRLIYRAIEMTSKSMKDIGEVHVQNVLELLNSQSGSKTGLPGRFTAVKMQDGIFFSKGEQVKKELEYDVLDLPREIVIKETGEKFTFHIEKWDSNKKISNDTYTKFLDYDKIKFRLKLRNRCPGDYIVIDDAGHQKKLKQYFIDTKVPARERDKRILLADGADIVWIPGDRISAKYKITAATTTILVAEYGGNLRWKE